MSSAPLRWIAPLLLGLAACGGSEDATPQSYARLALAPAADAQPARELAELVRWEPALEPDAWNFVTRRGQPRTTFLEREAVELIGRPDENPLVARVEAELDPRSFNRVVLEFGFRGEGSLHVDFRREGRALGRVSQELTSLADTLQVVSLDVPYAARGGELLDALTFAVTGASRTWHLVSVALLNVPPELALPTPAEGGLWWQQSEARRAVGLVSGRPLEAEIEVGAQASLRFGYAAPTETQLPGVECAVVLALSDVEGEELLRERLPLPPAHNKAGWQRYERALDEHAGQRVRLRLELESDAAQPVGAVVSELALAGPGDERPSVLLVTTDTHRADHLAAATNSVAVQTPLLDALAERGTLFEQCWTSANSTNPSHAALLTGVHPRDLYVHTNQQVLLDAAPTLAESFAAAGYRTWAAVSVEHLTDTYSGFGQGFDRMSGPGDVLRDGGDTVDVALAWLEELPERPVFLWLHVFDAHMPYETEEELRARYSTGPSHDEYPFDPPRFLEREQDVPDELETWLEERHIPNAREQRALYKAEVSYLDRELGRLFDVEPFRSGWTSVVGDHGESLGQHGIYWSHEGLYPDTLRVPLLLAGPNVPAGARVEGLVRQQDLGRTLLDLAGLPGAEFEGVNLLEDVHGPAPHYAIHANARSASLKKGPHYLLIQLRADQHDSVPHSVELYDLSADPDCRSDLVERDFARAKAMRAELLHWIQAAENRGWSAAAGTDARFQAQLAQLGYTDAELPASDYWEPDDCDWCARFE